MFLSPAPPPGCVVRALTVYVDISSRAQPVLRYPVFPEGGLEDHFHDTPRCPIHAAASDASNLTVPVAIHPHLIRSTEDSARLDTDKEASRNHDDEQFRISTVTKSRRTVQSHPRYHTDPTSGRCSVSASVKAAAPGCLSYPLLLHFLCLGSCLGGLAR